MIKRVGKLLNRSDFIRNVIKLSAATAFSQAIPFILLPVLQKWFYGPESFGTFSLFVSISSVIVAFASLKFEFAIVGADSLEKALNLTYVSIFLTVFTSICLAVFLLLASDNVLRTLGMLPLRDYWLWLTVSVFAFSGTQVMGYWFNFREQYGRIGYSKITQSVSAEGAKLILGGLRFGQLGLIIGRTLGQLVSLSYMLFLFFRENKGRIVPLASFKVAREQVKRHRNLALFSTPSALLGTLTNNFHIIMMAAYYDAATIGLIGTAFIYVAVPLGIISGSFSQVFFRRISGVTHRAEMARVYRSNATRLFLIGMACSIFVQLIPARLVEVVLGNEWTDSLYYLKIMVWYLLFSFVSSALSFIYIRLEKQREMLVLDIVHLLMVYASIYLGNMVFHDPVSAIMMFTGAQVVFYIMAIAAAFYFIRTSKLLS